jgi:hypothetical protein
MRSYQDLQIEREAKQQRERERVYLDEVIEEAIVQVGPDFPRFEAARHALVSFFGSAADVTVERILEVLASPDAADFANAIGYKTPEGKVQASDEETRTKAIARILSLLSFRDKYSLDNERKKCNFKSTSELLARVTELEQKAAHAAKPVEQLRQEVRGAQPTYSRYEPLPELCPENGKPWSTRMLYKELSTEGLKRCIKKFGPDAISAACAQTAARGE